VNLAGSISKKKVTLSWGASTDNVGVTGYRIYRNGTQVGSTVGTSYVDTVPGRPTGVTYYVRAYDAAGNLGPTSNALSLTP
jgi:chitodextrinase